MKFSTLPRFAQVLIGLFVMLAAAGILFWFFFVAVIDAGYVGVVDVFGSVSDNTLKSGINIKNPFARIIPVSIRTDEYTMSVAAKEGEVTGDDSIEARAADGAIVWVDVTVYYHLNQDQAAKLYKEIGLDYKSKIVRPEARSAVRAAVSKYLVHEVYSTKREELVMSMEQYLKEALSARGIEVESVLLRNVILSKVLSDSIEQKLTSQQEAQKLEFLIEKEKKEAERKLIEATGQRNAQRVISEGLTDRYLKYLYINTLKELKGTIYVPTEGGLPLFKNVN